MAKKVSKIKGEIKCHNHTTACYSLLIDFIISAFFLTLLSFYTAAAWRGPPTPPGRWPWGLSGWRLKQNERNKGRVRWQEELDLSNDMMLHHCSLAHSVYSLSCLLQLFGEKCNNVTRPGNATGIPTKCSLAFLIGFQPNKSDWSSLKGSRLMGLLHILLDFLLQ